MDQDLPLHLLGSPAFFPALITYIRSLSSSPSVPLDQLIVKSVLLCLVAGDKHLILRTPEDDIGLVVRLVAWTLSSVFNYTTHKLKIRSRTTSPTELWQSLYLPKRLSRSGTRTTLAPRHPRSISYPNDLSNSAEQQQFWVEPPTSRLHHSFSEPQGQVKHQELPRALILSGLENASTAVQQEVCDILSGNAETPQGFIAIYVCAANDTERPPIHKSLLDRFSLSHDVNISQSIRLALHSLFSSQSFSYSNPGSPTVVTYPLPTPPYFNKPLPSAHPSRQAPPPSFSAEPLPWSFIETLQKHCKRAYFAPELSLHLSDLFAAARHHPRLDGMLLTARARKDAEDLARAARVIGSDLTGMELIRPPDEKGDDESEYFDAQSDTRFLRTIDESSTTNLLRKDSVYGGSFSKVSSTGTVSEDGDEIRTMDVTAVDVYRTMPRVVTHRLSLRKGPEEEVLASAVVGATFGEAFDEKLGYNRGDGHRPARKGYGALTVKEILVEILNKV